MKQFLSILLLSLIIALVPHAVSHAEEPADNTVYTEGTLYYTISNDSITITGSFGKNEEVTVPAMIGGIPVNKIAKGAFSGNQYIKKLNLPDTISIIEDGAFPDGLKVIYNANTDHPQETPTEIILNGGVLNPTDTPKHTGGEQPSPNPVEPSVTLTTEPGKPTPEITATPSVTPSSIPANPTDVLSQVPSVTASPTPVVTEDPEHGGSQVGEMDVDIDDPVETVTITPTPLSFFTVTDYVRRESFDEAANNVKENNPSDKKSTHGFIIPCVVVVLCIIAGVVFPFIRKKK